MSDKESKMPLEKRPAGEPKQSGRVAYDAKGNPMWEWETSTGVFDRDISTQRLKKLEANLSLEDTQPVAKTNLSVQEPDRLPGGGINPYDAGGLTTSTAPAPAHPALAHKKNRDAPKSNSLVSKHAATVKRAAPAPEPPGLWQKLKALFSRDPI